MSFWKPKLVQSEAYAPFRIVAGSVAGALILMSPIFGSELFR